ncbi:hypothetical protein REJ26_000612 [Providencia stuartii]|uniref:Phage shock protein D n=2 Tax=Providencia TaxID=586 RepID=A0A1S1HKG0_PROST|nr:MULTISPECIES: hypothetical protein [Providencia]MDV5225828.1 hypothetical protein [Providencia rettgeri]ELR5040589.1 hypothetical protein [Providencia stuartii]ELR5081559.1 hypothetical protein [Providencia stuartii]ELR5111850.1 hypothetical protein [Providencia stuartii]ELR5298887.1 hypothetical protein [Providencia stuartii]
MHTHIKRKFQQQVKKQAVGKVLKVVVTLAMTYGPGGVIGKVIKIVGSKWVISYLTKRLTR